VISSDGDNVRIRRVRIRANCYYMCMDAGRSHHRRGVEERALDMGSAIELWGANTQVTDCDIYHSARAFSLMHMRGGLIARNKVLIAAFGLSAGAFLFHSALTHAIPRYNKPLTPVVIIAVLWLCVALARRSCAANRCHVERAI
jgi:hypothetical protein